jgi:hypothetical protein
MSSGGFGSRLLRVEGLRGTEQAMRLLGKGEHLWVRGIGGVLIYVCRLGEASYRMSVCSAERMARRFSVKRLGVDARVGQVEAYRLVEKLGARPCRVVRNSLVDERATVGIASGGELSYEDFVSAVRGLGLRIQANP